QSNPIDALIRWKSGSCGSPNRDMAASLGRVAEGAGECLAHAVDVALAHRRVEGQRQRPPGDAPGYRGLAAAEAETPAVERHQVDAGKVGLALDSLAGEGLDHGIALGVGRQLDDVDEPAASLLPPVGAGQDERLAVALPGRGGAELGEGLRVERRDPGP